MRIGKRTARLVREAIVLGHVEGAWFGRAVPYGDQEEGYPADSVVFFNALRSARSNRDKFPTLAKFADDIERQAAESRAES